MSTPPPFAPAPTLNRRQLGRLAVLGASALVAACAPWRPTTGPERRLALPQGLTLSETDWLDTLRHADLVLLGEHHDNARHHGLRGELIGKLGPRGKVVVAEHLERGRQLAPFPAGTRPTTAELLTALQAAGFEPRGWLWPLHEGLFAPLARAGVDVLGGNLPRELARRIAREGESAWPDDLGALLKAAPLAPAAQARLDEELLASHCGQLPPQRLPGMRAAQRARDAAMAQALLRAWDASPGRPVWLVAGNAHVRLDYGVGQLLAALRPQARVLSVALLDGDERSADLPSPELYTHAWITAAPAQRESPCG
jgi:uncharacterized iron-regulated protein